MLDAVKAKPVRVALVGPALTASARAGLGILRSGRK